MLNTLIGYSRCATDILVAWFISALRIKLKATLLWRSAVMATTGKASLDINRNPWYGRRLQLAVKLDSVIRLWPEERAWRGSPAKCRALKSQPKEDDLVPSKEGARASAGCF